MCVSRDHLLHRLGAAIHEGNRPADIRHVRLFGVDAEYLEDETRPVPVATYQVDPAGLARPGRRFGAHQPWEHIRDDSVVFLAWFGGGVRAVDISNPYAPREVGYYIPPPAAGREVPQTNDVFVDRRGLVFAIDRDEGLSVLEFAPRP